MKQYIIDAFTNQVFSGNPAAVCVMNTWPDEEWMKKLARENNLSETAFIVKESDNYHLRWFTPGKEVELCGHATLASAYVIMNFIEPDKNSVEFDTLSGKLEVKRKDNLFEMDFPTYPLREIPVTEEMERAFGIRPQKALLGIDLICIFPDEEMIFNMSPDEKSLKILPGRIQNVTAPGKEYDCISRSFAPKLSIKEDPVCGSAHCQIADFWSQYYKKSKIKAYQASERGGELLCELLENERIKISGEAALFSIAEILPEKALS